MGDGVINWPLLIARLTSRIPHSVLAELMGHTPSWLTRLRDGTIPAPRWDDGERLLNLYREKYSRDVADIQRNGVTTV